MELYYPQGICLQTVVEIFFILSKNYTYPVIARVRRGLLDTLMKGISVHIEPPGIEWDKIIGNSKIGASFGLHIRNILDLKLGKQCYSFSRAQFISITRLSLDIDMSDTF